MKKITLTILLIIAFLVSNAHVALTYPVGGESFLAGQEVEIRWEVLIQHDTQNWDLYFSSDGGETWEPIILDLPVPTLTYVWTVPDNETNQGKVRVVQDNNGPDYLDDSGIFSITGTTGLHSFSFKDIDLKIYPNPAHDHISIVSSVQMENISLNISDMQGRIIAYFKVDLISANDPFYVSLNAIKAGTYYLQLIQGKSVISRKVIVR